MLRAVTLLLVIRSTPREYRLGAHMAELVRQVAADEHLFGLKAAAHLIADVMAPWVQDLGLLVESVESVRPSGARADWQPGVVVRLPFSPNLRRDGGVACSQVLLALADSAMMLACAAAWNGYRPMTAVDQTMHFLRPVNFDVVADARMIRIGRHTSFGRATLYGASDLRPVGMTSSAYAML